MQFEEPQKFAISSADVDFKWNCRHTILTATPKKFNFALYAKKSHNFMALIEGWDPQTTNLSSHYVI